MQPLKIADLEVSRETSARLEAFIEAVQAWNRQLNIVSQRSLADIWSRHIEDSAQLWHHRPSSTQRWIDMGSGGGFPGLVVAILAAELAPHMAVTLIEADQRKAAFLRHCAAILTLDITLWPGRIEAYRGPPGHCISARALADLNRLLELAIPIATTDTVFLFPKGRSGLSELTFARRHWSIDVEVIDSRTDPDSVLLKISGVGRKS